MNPVNPVKILVCDSMAEEGLKLLKQAGFQLDLHNGLKEEALLPIIANYDAALVRSATTITEKVIQAGTKLKLIGRAGIGVDNIDVTAATRRGVLVMNTPDANATTTAELAITLLLSLARKIPQADLSMKQGKWEKSKFVGTEVTGKTLGIVGFGRIGRVVAERGLGLKMRVIAYDPFIASGESPVKGVGLASFDKILEEADFITIHSPLNDSTKNLFRKETFAKMKPGAKLINCARGGIVNEVDLYEALQKNTLSGAALDVFVQEPPKDSPLLSCQNAIFTPHLGASTDEAQLKVSIDIAQQTIDFFRSGAARNAVNAPTISAEVSEILQPFVVLGEKMGAFLGQTMEGGARRIEISYRGEIHELDLTAVRSAILAGLFRPSLGIPVNQINAPYIAAERGVKILESREPKDRDYLNRVSMKAWDANNKEFKIAGTVFGRHPRFVEINGFRLDAIAEGDLLFTRHMDRPGMIGRMGTILGSRSINISRLQLGSSDNGDGNAIAILSLSSPLPSEVLEELRKDSNIVEARYVRL